MILAGPKTSEDKRETDLLLSLGLTPESAWGSALARVGLSENMEIGVEAKAERDFSLDGDMDWEIMGQFRGRW